MTLPDSNILNPLTQGVGAAPLSCATWGKPVVFDLTQLSTSPINPYVAYTHASNTALMPLKLPAFGGFVYLMHCWFGVNTTQPAVRAWAKLPNAGSDTNPQGINATYPANFPDLQSTGHFVAITAEGSTETRLVVPSTAVMIGSVPGVWNQGLPLRLHRTGAETLFVTVATAAIYTAGGGYLLAWVGS